jgi:polysaccharide export outer membrane protein
MWYLFFIILLFGCSNRPYLGEDALGAREFVLDSYKISQGKASILTFEGKEITALDPVALEEYVDTLVDGDALYLRFYHPTRLSMLHHLVQFSQTPFFIENGMVELPEVGSITLKGYTLKEAKEKIRIAYQKWIPDLEVFLSYKEGSSKQVEIAGMSAVSHVSVNGKLRLFDLLALARIPTTANLFKSYVTREGKLLCVDLERLVREGDMSQNIVMRPQDKVYIAGIESADLFVMGEVARQGAIPVIKGSMSLREALAKAGGIGITGDKAYIQVIRGNLTKPKIYTLTWNHLIHLPTEHMLLLPGDIVYVAATPIVQWNRFINLLFPSFTAYEFFNKGIQGVIVQ